MTAVADARPGRAPGRRAAVGRTSSAVVVGALMTLVVLVLVAVPLWLVVVTSVQPFEDARQLDVGWPENLTLDNFVEVFQRGEIVRGLVNSLLVVVPSVAVLLLAGSAAAWVFARATSRGIKVLYYVTISGILLPPTVVTTVRLFDSLGVYGTRGSLVLFYAGAWMSLAVFLVTGFVRTIPVELEESARLDGAGTFRVFWHVVLPSLRPILWTATIFLTLILWNDFFYAFFLLRGSERATLPLGLYEFASASQYELAWNLIFADILVVSLPLLLLYLLGQRHVVAGLTRGALK